MENETPQANHSHRDGALNGDDQPHNDDCALKGLTTVLMEAASTGNIALLQNMLDTGLDLNVVTEDGYIAMHCAAKTGQVEMLRYLLSKGAAIDPCNASAKGRRPIHEAISGHHSEAVSVLLQAGADIMKPDYTENTVLNHVSLAGNMEVTQALFSEERRQISALDMALNLVRSYARSGKCSILRWLLARYPVALPTLGNTQQSLICFAVLSGSVETLQLLLESYKDDMNHAVLGATVSHAFYRAIKIQNGGAAELLLKHDALDISHKVYLSNTTALHLAAKQGNERLVELILGHRSVNVNSVNWHKRTPLHEAAEKGNIEALRLLLSHEDIDVQRKDYLGQSALCLAFMRCRWNTVKLIMKHLDENTGLGFESQEGELPIADLAQFSSLIDHLLDHNLLSKIGQYWRRLIEKTIIADEVELMKLLFTHLDVDVNANIGSQWPNPQALHIAAESHSHDMFVLYLDHPQIDVNSKQSFGCDVLHSAVQYNCMIAVKLLLAQPALDLTHTYRHRTALDLAQSLGRREMFELLLQHGAPGKSLEWDAKIADTTHDAESCCNSKRKVAAPQITTEADHSNMEHTADTMPNDESEDEDMSIDDEWE